MSQNIGVEKDKSAWENYETSVLKHETSTDQFISNYSINK